MALNRQAVSVPARSSSRESAGPRHPPQRFETFCAPLRCEPRVSPLPPLPPLDRRTLTNWPHAAETNDDRGKCVPVIFGDVIHVDPQMPACCWSKDHHVRQATHEMRRGSSVTTQPLLRPTSDKRDLQCHNGSSATSRVCNPIVASDEKDSVADGVHATAARRKVNNHGPL